MTRRQLLYAGPFGAAAVAGVGFWAMLRGMETGSFDPRGVPSPVTGHEVPVFDLPSQPPGQGFASRDLGHGQPVLLNWFASWCIPCAEEHPALMELAQVGMPIWAIAYKDQPDKAAHFISRHGDPYQRIASDELGRTAIDFGLSGVPESFLIDGHGVIRWHWAGPLDASTIAKRLQPAWRTLV